MAGRVCDYLRRAAGQSANTLDLYQRVTEYMVRGELAPTATQDMLGCFVPGARHILLENGSLSSTMRFFAEMVRNGTAYSSELGRA